MLLNSIYGELIYKNVEESFECKSEHWMKTEYDERVKDYWKITYGNYIVKLIDDVGFEDEVKKIALWLCTLVVLYYQIVKEL